MGKSLTKTLNRLGPKTNKKKIKTIQASTCASKNGALLKSVSPISIPLCLILSVTEFVLSCGGEISGDFSSSPNQLKNERSFSTGSAGGVA